MARKIISAILLTAILAGCASCGSGTPDSGNDTTVSKDTTTGGADTTAEWVNPGIGFRRRDIYDSDAPVGESVADREVQPDNSGRGER